MILGGNSPRANDFMFCSVMGADSPSIVTVEYLGLSPLNDTKEPFTNDTPESLANIPVELLPNRLMYFFLAVIVIAELDTSCERI